MLNIYELTADIKDLMSVVLGKADDTLTAKFSEISKEDAEKTLREKFNALYDPTDFYASDEGKKACFRLIAENVTQELPKAVLQQFGLVIEQQSVAIGDKPKFIVRTGMKNLRKFVTKTAQNGIFRKGTLDKKEVTFDYYTIGGGCKVSLREYLAGFLTMAELQKIILDQAVIAIYNDVQTLLKATYSSLPTANKHEGTAFVEAEMDEIIDTVSAYGTPVIYCTKKFARTMPLVSTYDQKGINDIHTYGFVKDYRGTNVVVLDQSFLDEDNAEVLLDDEYAYILPVGKESIIKLVYEGQMRIKDEDSALGEKEFQFEQNVGMTTVFVNNIGMYRNTSL